MTEPSTPKHRDWIEIGLKALTPITAGIVIAFVGFWSNQTLSEISSREESARLITQLQVEREQAESNLRKDVFDQALGALFSKEQNDGSSRSLSKRLLRLELLALNFGDALSLSPLFNEFRRELEAAEGENKQKEIDFNEKIDKLRKRLIGLARRVASGQLSALEQKGLSVKIIIPLPKEEVTIGKTCPDILLKNKEFVWPEDVLAREIKKAIKQWAKVITQGQDNTRLSQEVEDEIKIMLLEESIPSEKVFEAQRHADHDEENEHVPNNPSDVELLTLLKDDLRGIISESTKHILTFGNITRRIKLTVSNVERCTKTAEVTLHIQRFNASEDEPEACRPWNCQPHDARKFPQTVGTEGTTEVKRTFDLNFFNFPIVDNTRLSNNHRFALVMEEFEAENREDDPHLGLRAVIFPAEYASLRDRPGMKEAMELLQSAIRTDSSDILLKEKE